MAANPNPDRITDELWRFVEECLALEPGSDDVNAGTITDKPGYHGTRAWNQKYAPGNYSIRDAEDLGGPHDKTAAFDWTFRSAQAGNYDRIMIYAGRLLRSGQDPADPRGNGLREFYGQADKDTAVEGWDFRYVGPRTSDASHLWHIHFSFDRDKVNDRATFDAVLSILRGETVAQWLEQEEDDMFVIKALGGPLVGKAFLCEGRDPTTGLLLLTACSASAVADYRAAGIRYAEVNNINTTYYTVRTPPLPGPTAEVDEDAIAAKTAAAVAALPPHYTEAQHIEFARKGANLAEDS